MNKSRLKTIHDLPTPALLLDWPAARRNIEWAAAFVADKPVQLRPHFKHHKCVPLAKAQMEAGGCVGMTTATVAEAKALVEGGITDVLIANQVLSGLDQLVEIAERNTIRVLVDDVANAHPIAEAGLAAGFDIGVLVEVDIGTHRSGVHPGEPALDLVRHLIEMPGVRFDGLHAYHGHVVNILEPDDRAESARVTMQLAIDTRRLVESAGIPCQILTGGGAATYKTIGKMDGVDELQIGSYVGMDWSYKERVGADFEIAFSVLATVISVSTQGMVLDVGVKGIAHESGPPRLLDHPNFEIPRFKSEEHTIVKAEGHGLSVGDRIRLTPSHGCGTCNLYNQIVICDGDEVRDIWTTSARGYSIPS